MVAAYIAAGRAAELPDALKALKIGHQASFEVAFNCGCAMLATSDLEPARQQLLHAQRLGQHLSPQESVFVLLAALPSSRIACSAPVSVPGDITGGMGPLLHSS